MKIARILALLVAVAGAAAAVYLFSRPAETPAGAPRTGTASGGADFDPEPGARTGDPPSTAGMPLPATPGETPQLPQTLPETGTPVAPGAAVAVAQAWGRGEKTTFQFEIDDVVLVKDRKTERVEPGRTVYWVTLTVLSGDGTGAARLRLVIDRTRTQFLGPLGLPVDLDSRVREDPQLEDPQVKRRVLPGWAILGRPVEFLTDASGNVLDVDGLDDWTERYVSEAQRLEKNPTAEVEDAPRREWVSNTWSEFLFPRIGGGTIAGGASRPWQRVDSAGGGWSVVWEGKLRPTRDDADAFRVDFTAKPREERTGGVPVNASQAAIERVQAIGRDDAYRAAYRISRTDGAVIEAQIDYEYMFNGSRRVSSARPGQPAQYDPRFLEIRRRVVVRRTGE